MAGDAYPAPSRMSHARSGLRRVLITIGLGVGATAGALLIAGAARADDSGVRERPGLTRVTHAADSLIRLTTDTRPVRTRQQPVPRPPAQSVHTGRTGGAATPSRATKPHSSRTSATTARRHVATHSPVTARIEKHGDAAGRPTRAPGGAHPISGAIAVPDLLWGTTATVTNLVGGPPQLPPVLPVPPSAEAPAPGSTAMRSDLPAAAPATWTATGPERTTTAVAAAKSAEPSDPAMPIRSHATDPGSGGAHPGTAPARPHGMPGSLPASPTIPAASAVPVPGGGHGPAATTPVAATADLTGLPTLQVRPVRAPRGSANAPDTRPG